MRSPASSMALVWLLLAACAGRSSAPLQPVEPAPAPIASSPLAGYVDPAQAGAPEPSRPEPTARPPEPEPPPRETNPYVVPPVRRSGDLTVEAPPRTIEGRIGGRMRAHVDGALSKGSPRTWVGPQVPYFVPLGEGTAELFLLDRVGDEFMAFYRDPYDASSCALSGHDNCHYFVKLYDLEGQVRWSVALHELLSAPRYLEVQDVRWADGTLYFNEACQSYASGAKGKCSALVAYDPVAKQVRWRTRPLVSNNMFVLHGDYIVCGYGFTSERDHVFVVRRRDGKIMQKLSVPTAPEHFAIAGDGALEVELYGGTRRRYALQGWDGPAPKLVLVDRKPAEPPTKVLLGPP